MNIKNFLVNAGKANDKIDLNSEIFNIDASVYGSNKARGWNSRDGIVDPCFENTGKITDVICKTTKCR